MPFFENEGVKIYYEIEGDGPDLIMIHGFAANIEINWRITNWIKTLKDNNRLILIDCRGHGKSDKPTDPVQYGKKMMEDIVKLMDHLSIEKSNFFGYSMGGSITFGLLLHESNRVKSAVLGGFIPSQINREQMEQSNKPIINAFSVESVEQVKNPVAKQFRKFAESTGADLKALTAVMMGFTHDVDEIFASFSEMKSTFKNIKVPVLSVVGSDDALMTNKTLVAELIPGACHFQIQGKDHVTVVPDPKFHMVVKAFLNYVNNM
jgi:pimeloyl-ACP methyl ester carboxylesterase